MYGMTNNYFMNRNLLCRNFFHLGSIIYYRTCTCCYSDTVDDCINAQPLDWTTWLGRRPDTSSLQLPVFADWSRFCQNSSDTLHGPEIVNNNGKIWAMLSAHHRNLEWQVLMRKTPGNPSNSVPVLKAMLGLIPHVSEATRYKPKNATREQCMMAAESQLKSYQSHSHSESKQGGQTDKRQMLSTLCPLGN